MDNVSISLFNKMADVDAILDDRLVFEVITVTFTKIKPDIFAIFRKKSGISGNIFRRYYVILCLGLME